MNDKKYGDWFEDEFWPLYKELVKTPFVTRFGAGAKGEAKKRASMMKPSQDLKDRILQGVRAQIIHRKERYARCGSMAAYQADTKFNKLYSNRHGSTFLFNNGWDDELPSLTEASVSPSFEAVCATVDCNNPTHGRNFTECIDCLGEKGYTKFDVYENLKRMGLEKLKSETHGEWLERVKKAGRI